MKASEVIREAKNLLFERGWCQGDLTDTDGSVCIRGALCVAATGSAYCTTSASLRADEVLQYAINRLSIPSWNDEPGRTFGEVIDALDRAEKLALQHEEHAP